MSQHRMNQLASMHISSEHTTIQIPEDFKKNIFQSFLYTYQGHRLKTKRCEN